MTVSRSIFLYLRKIFIFIVYLIIFILSFSLFAKTLEEMQLTLWMHLSCLLSDFAQNFGIFSQLYFEVKFSLSNHFHSIMHSVSFFFFSVMTLVFVLSKNSILVLHFSLSLQLFLYYEFKYPLFFFFYL